MSTAPQEELLTESKKRHPPVAAGEVHEVTIEKLVFGGDGLARIGSQAGLWPFAEVGYRSGAEIKVAHDAEGQPHIGYFRAGTHEVCEVADCPLLVPAANRELQHLHAERRLIPHDATRVYLTAGDEGVIVTPATGEHARAAEIDALGTAHQRIASMDYGFGVRSFFQANRLLVEELVNVAVGEARGKLAIDLY